MNQYQKTTEKKKQAVIQAALRLFKDKGFKETSIKSIAEAAEVSPVSIYNYFGSKDNLVTLCVNDLFEEITQQAEDILNSNLDFKTKLDQAFALCQEKMSQQISDYFQDKMVEDSVFSTLLTKAITAKKRDIYRAYIHLGKAEGLIAEDLSTELILNVMDALNGMG
ncbi:MAG: TetR/AcrR family transcriptional regulator, partial [Streptococcus sp.]|nr:TetR/AcrR family transcriptional regulator [Streptococcus sp.]